MRFFVLFRFFLMIPGMLTKFPLPQRCECVSLRGSTAQTEGTLRGRGVWRVENHLTRHFGGLMRGLIVAVCRAVHGAVCVGAGMLVVGRVAAAAVALGVRVGAGSLVGV